MHWPFFSSSMWLFQFHQRGYIYWSSRARSSEGHVPPCRSEAHLANVPLRPIASVVTPSPDLFLGRRQACSPNEYSQRQTCLNRFSQSLDFTCKQQIADAVGHMTKKYCRRKSLKSQPFVLIKYLCRISMQSCTEISCLHTRTTYYSESIIQM